MKNVCAFTSICEEDACWADQYLAEMGRLDLRFVVHLDRCSDGLKAKMSGHKLCAGSTFRDDPNVEFTEQHKQSALDLVRKAKFRWALAMDIDETWEKGATAKLSALFDVPDCLLARWVNLWETAGQIRVDGQFKDSFRVKLLRMDRAYKWTFDHPITNGPKAFASGNLVDVMPCRIDLVCLHWGMMTRELRLQHKDRWDRIYTRAVGANPYGFWNYALDEVAYPPVTMTHAYLE
jgi:hypothetical protein